MPHVVHITTVPDSLGFIDGLVGHLLSTSWDVTVVSSPGLKLGRFTARHRIDGHSVAMTRAITPVADVDAIARLTDVLLDVDPDVVHAHTPKGGFLGMMAAQAAMAPVRIYQMRGLLTPTANGIRKRLFARAERTSCKIAHRVICQSESLRELAVESRIVPAHKAAVLANGSNGVDAVSRFNPANVTGLDVRRQLDIGGDEQVIGFVGRIVRDKGITELIDAWRAIKGQFPLSHLLMVGPFEQRDAVDDVVQRALRDDPRVHLVGFVRDTPRYYEAMDFLVLPSHREGFPNAPLEAAAMGIPTIASDAVGCVDAVVDGLTGQLVPVGDSIALAAAIGRYLAEPELRVEHGAAARARVLADFRPEDVHRAITTLYDRLLRQDA